MTDFAQSADTRIIRGHHFEAYTEALEGTRRTFDDTVNANLPLITGAARSDIDRVVEQLPSPEQTDDVLTLLARLPTGDQHQLAEAASLFERIEAENRDAAGGWLDSGRGGTANH